MNLDCMSEPQIERLRRAMRELFELNHWAEDRRSYNNLALIHQNHCQHGWERFLPWHRMATERVLAEAPLGSRGSASCPRAGGRGAGPAGLTRGALPALPSSYRKLNTS
jgi:hypothetical protein